MFVAAKAIFSLFAIPRARVQTIEFDFWRARGRNRLLSAFKFLLFESLAREMTKVLKIALAATNIAQTSMLSFTLLVLWSLDVTLQKWVLTFALADCVSILSTFCSTVCVPLAPNNSWSCSFVLYGSWYVDLRFLKPDPVHEFNKIKDNFFVSTYVFEVSQ